MPWWNLLFAYLILGIAFGLDISHQLNQVRQAGGKIRLLTTRTNADGKEVYRKEEEITIDPISQKIWDRWPTTGLFIITLAIFIGWLPLWIFVKLKTVKETKITRL